MLLVVVLNEPLPGFKHANMSHPPENIDFIGGEFTVSFPEEADVTSCVRVGVRDDTIFEDVEDFFVILLPPPGAENVQVGRIERAEVLIDDLRKFLCHCFLIWPTVSQVRIMLKCLRLP